MNQLLRMLLLSCLGMVLFHGFKPVSNAYAEEAENVPEISKTVGYDKGFYIVSPDERFKLTMGGYIQGLFLGEIVEGGSDVDTFRVRRARLKFSGHLYSKNIKYQLEYDFAGNKLLTTYLKLVHSDPLRVTVGQFKVPFNVEGISSGSTLQFVDRSLVHAFFGIKDERETGLELSGDLMEKKFEYAVAALNGEGINTLNENNELRYVGRLVYNAMGHHGYEFSDTKQSEEPNIAFGIAGMYNDTPNSDATAENKVTSLTADASLKYLGLGAHGGFFYQKTNPDGAGGNDNDYGLLSQIGYFVMPKTLEVGARYARVFADSGSDQTEYTGGLNYYIHAGHRVKLQLDYSVLVGEDGISAGDDQVNHRVRAQLQVKI